MGSANVTVNGGFTSITAATTTAGWTAIPVGSVIELRSTAGNEVGPGFAVSVDIDATAPTTTGTYTWDSDARPTNDFTGTAELTLIGADPAVTVTPGPLDHFTIANIVDQVAGTAFNVAATARDQYNNVKTDYAGGATLSGNLGTAPDSTAPSYGSFGTWASGVASASVTAFNAESGRSVTATDGSATGTSNSFTVAPGPIDHFTFATILDQVAGAAFNVTATAFDQWDNVKTDYASGATLSGNLSNAPDNTAPIYSSFGTWASGVANATVTAYKAESGDAVTATDGSATGTSNAFTVAPGPLDHFTIASIVDQVAGAPFNVTATAFDEWDNVKTDYAGGATTGREPEQRPGRHCAYIRRVRRLGERRRQRQRHRLQGREWPHRDRHRRQCSRHEQQLYGRARPARQVHDRDHRRSDRRHSLQRHRHRVRRVGQREATTRHGRRDAVRDAVELHAGLRDRQCLAMLAHLRQLWHLGRRCREWFVTAFKAETSRTVTATDSGKTGTSNAFAVTPNVATAPPARFSEQPTLTERLQIINNSVGVKVTQTSRACWASPRSGGTTSPLPSARTRAVARSPERSPSRRTRPGWRPSRT